MRDNRRMLKMTEKMGFQRRDIPEEDVVEVTLNLQ